MKLTIQRGIRRVALVVGLAGAVAGGFLAWPTAEQIRGLHQRAVIVQKIIRRLREAQPPPKGAILYYSAQRDKIDRGVIPDDASLAGPPETVSVYVNQDDVDKVIVYRRTGLISSVTLKNGETLADAPLEPAWHTYLFPLFAPLAGFLLPWGVIRLLAWTISGFIAKAAETN